VKTGPFPDHLTYTCETCLKNDEGTNFPSSYLRSVEGEGAYKIGTMLNVNLHGSLKVLDLYGSECGKVVENSMLPRSISVENT